MMKFFRKKLNKRGFTLIELVVVIAILGILAMIAIPRLSGFSENAKQATDKEAAAVVANAAAMYYATTQDTSIDISELEGANLIVAGDTVMQSVEYAGGIDDPIIVTADVVTVILDGVTADYTITK